jgi:hypothetical protein
MGITVGGLAGLLQGAFVLMRQNYLGHHLFNTAAWTMAVRIDRLLLFFIAGAYAVQAISAAGGSRNRSLRGVGHAVVIGGLAVIYAVMTGLTVRLSERFAATGGFEIVPAFLSEGKWQIVGAAACVALGVTVLKRIRRSRQTPDTAGDSERPPFRSSAFRIGRLAPAVLAAVALFNVVAGILHARTAISIRGKPNVIFIMVDTLRADHLG